MCVDLNKCRFNALACYRIYNLPIGYPKIGGEKRVNLGRYPKDKDITIICEDTQIIRQGIKQV